MRFLELYILRSKQVSRPREVFIFCLYQDTIVSMFAQTSLCTDVTLDEVRERTSASWMKIPCSGHVDFPQICGKASDWTVLYLNNI
jgi:hypothetical protein